MFGGYACNEHQMGEYNEFGEESAHPSHYILALDALAPHHFVLYVPRFEGYGMGHAVDPFTQDIIWVLKLIEINHICCTTTNIY